MIYTYTQAKLDEITGRLCAVSTVTSATHHGVINAIATNSGHTESWQRYVTFC